MFLPIKRGHFCPIFFLEISNEEIQWYADYVADQGHHQTERHRRGWLGYGTTGRGTPGTQRCPREELGWQRSACCLIAGRNTCLG